MAPVEGRNVRTNKMFSTILAMLFAIKKLGNSKHIVSQVFVADAWS